MPCGKSGEVVQRIRQHCRNNSRPCHRCAVTEWRGRCGGPDPHFEARPGEAQRKEQVGWVVEGSRELDGRNSPELVASAWDRGRLEPIPADERDDGLRTGGLD